MAKYGGPAFPSHGSMGEVLEYGMTLRDYFAAAAIGGILAQRVEVLNSSSVNHETVAGFVAEQAYIMADAMIVERVKSDFIPPHKGQGISDNPYVNDRDSNEPDSRAMRWHNALLAMDDK